MIRTISDYLYVLHRDRQALLIKADQRKAAFLVVAFVALVTLSAILWILYI